MMAAAEMDHFGRMKPFTPRSTMGDMFCDPPEDDRMRSTNTLQFSTSDEPQRRRSARPTSHTRKNNPHASKSFQSRTLPSGEIIHVATPSYRNVSRAQGARNPGTEAGKIPTTSARETFGTPVLESWQKGNTKRYGLRDKPWANSAHASVGIVPSVNKGGLRELSQTLPTTREAYRGGNDFERFAPTSSRRSPARVDDSERDVIRTVVKDEASDAVESWIRGAPGFEGEIVKRMMREISGKVRVGQPSQPGRSSGRPATPPLDYVSDWAGPIM